MALLRALVAVAGLSCFWTKEEGKMCDFDGDYDGLEWQDWMIIGPLSEDIAEEKRRRRKIEREMFGDDDDEPF